MPEAFARPFRPVELTASTLTFFPLQAMAQQLMTEDAFQTSGRNALTLIYHTNLTVVLTVLKAGAGLDEHHAPAPVTLLPLFGEIILTSAEGTTRLTLAQGTGAVFAAHLPHRVEAQQDSAFILVIGGQALRVAERR
jgi:quercetin dioxygenase-like cupin family protein